ncbi:sensor histidine kinase [Nocardia uniformis]|uniref:histidine kinase n=1 Tax=Nocardia uniformis TaxID=53432 RepID=A0A849CB83_9NOCA|nr:sensor histidine kinase [Nocardia uniformis]NNH75792.1 sensor histidine kinase [Nocardia uniformis]
MTAWARGRRDEVPPWLLDLLLGGAVTLALAFIIALGQGGQRAADPVAYLFAAGFGALMLWRRRFPLPLLAATVAGIFGYHALGYPPLGVAVPLAAALFAAADAGAMWTAALTGAFVLTWSFGFRIHEGESAAYLAGYEGVPNGAVIVTAIALGSAVRSRRVRMAQQAEITRLTAEQSARQAELRVRGEREGMSRDLHDTIGHAMSVISLQAGVAAEAIGHDDRQARTAVDNIRDTSARSLRDVRSMVRLLRGEESATHDVLSLAGVPALVAQARGVGIDVTCELTAPVDRLPPAVDATAYRIVQEAITNVVRHADATEATITAAIGDGMLRVTVSDNGTTAVPHAGAEHGHGIAGMRERVRLLGGTLTAGSRGRAGFLVDARIPIAVPE